MEVERTYDPEKMRIRAVNIRLTEAEYKALRMIAVSRKCVNISAMARLAIRQFILENMEVT